MADPVTWTAIGAVTAGISAAASAGYQVHQGRMERRHAKGVAREQAR